MDEIIKKQAKLLDFLVNNGLIVKLRNDLLSVQSNYHNKSYLILDTFQLLY